MSVGTEGLGSRQAWVQSSTFKGVIKFKCKIKYKLNPEGGRLGFRVPGSIFKEKEGFKSNTPDFGT